MFACFLIVYNQYPVTCNPQHLEFYLTLFLRHMLIHSCGSDSLVFTCAYITDLLTHFPLSRHFKLLFLFCFFSFFIIINNASVKFHISWSALSEKFSGAQFLKSMVAEPLVNNEIILMALWSAQLCAKKEDKIYECVILSIAS